MEILYGIPVLPEGEGPTIVFPQHLEESGQILGFPRIEAVNPVKHIRGVSRQRRHYQGHEVRILIVITIVRDAVSPLPEGAGHIMSMALLASKFGYLDLTQKSILFLTPSPRGVSAIGVTATPAATAPTPMPPAGGAYLKWRYRWIPLHPHRMIGGDWEMPFSWESQGQNPEQDCSLPIHIKQGGSLVHHPLEMTAERPEVEMVEQWQRG